MRACLNIQALRGSLTPLTFAQSNILVWFSASCSKVSRMDTYEHVRYSPGMNVRLGKFEAWVQARVDSGDYASHAEVIRAGLRLLKEEQEWRQHARRKIAEGLADLQAGRTIDGDEALARIRSSVGKRKRKKA